MIYGNKVDNHKVIRSFAVVDSDIHFRGGVRMGRASDGMKCIEIRSLLKKGAFEDAMEVAETIDISKI